MISKNSLLSLGIFNDNEYLDKYIFLIETNINTKKSKDTQRHHIVPRYYFNQRNLPVDNKKSNIVNLRFSDHIYAHYLLALCSITKKNRIGNESAMFRMAGRFGDIDIKNLDKYNDLYEELQKNNREKHLGKTHDTSYETRVKISNANSGRYCGDIHIYKGDLEKHLKPEESEKYLNDGWQIGRSPKTRKSLSKNYNYSVKGMLGKKQSDYQKECVRNALLGKKKSESAKKNMSLSKTGKVLVSNDLTKETFYVEKDMIDEYLEKGYRKGRLNK